MPNVIDCFPFNNEIDLLELRLATLDAVVDRFVLVESTKTYSGLDKPLYYKKNAKRFSRWGGRITHVVVRDAPEFARRGSKRPDRLSLQAAAHQYDAIRFGLASARAEDVLLVGDIDEIPGPKTVVDMVRALGTSPIVKTRMTWCAYYLNGLRGSWIGMMALQKSVLDAQRGGILKLRHHVRRDGAVPTVAGGWHFSWTGGPEVVVEKLRSAAHRGQDTAANRDPAKMKAMMDAGIYHCNGQKVVRYVELDGSFPSYLVANPKRFYHMLHAPSGGVDA